MTDQTSDMMAPLTGPAPGTGPATGRATLAAIRFGYGLGPAGTPQPQSAEEILATLAGPDHAAQRWPMETLLEELGYARQVIQANRQRHKAPTKAERDAGQQQLKKILRAQRGRLSNALRIQVTRAALSPDPFRERLVAFWSDHFTTVGKVSYFRLGPSLFSDEAIRPHVSGNFRDMLRAATTHPAMLLYLDQDKSIGPDSPAGEKRKAGINENLGRELLELHTVGVHADYTQHDVRQFAELLTGLGVSLKDGFQFHPQWAEPGAETVMGRAYGGENPAQLNDIFKALDDIAMKPATAQHLSHKLAVHFVSDTPDPDLVAAMTKAYTDSGGELMATYRAMLAHPAAWAPQREKVRQPWDYVIAGLRAINADEARLSTLDDKHLARFIERPMTAMGQRWQHPLGPNGWPEDPNAWITPQGLAERINWAMSIGPNLRLPLADPRSFVDSALADAASPDLVQAAARAESPREGVGLVLASADFNRR